MTKNHLLSHLIGKVRRIFLFHCNKRYIRNQLTLRQGACRQCGRCCRFLFNCPLLTSEGRCLGYEKWRWAVCKVFPFDQRDIDEVALDGGTCGYWFDQP